MIENKVVLISLYFDPKQINIKENIWEMIKSWFQHFGFSIERRTGRGKIVNFIENKIFYTSYFKKTSHHFYSGSSGKELQMLNWQIYAKVNFESGELSLFVYDKFIEESYFKLLEELLNRFYPEIIFDYGYIYIDSINEVLKYNIGIVFFLRFIRPR